MVVYVLYMLIPDLYVHVYTLLRLDVSARMPGLGAPRDSMNVESLSLKGSKCRVMTICTLYLDKNQLTQ